MYVVHESSPNGTFNQFVGPFTDIEQAQAWIGKNAILGQSYMVCFLTHPEEAPKAVILDRETVESIVDAATEPMGVDTGTMAEALYESAINAAMRVVEEK